ncbi:MAG: tetratricopeptide repeat protein [Planctomycetota bacterium]|jgi:tetratricopeptide (TPR) repeat protein
MLRKTTKANANRINIRLFAIVLFAVVLFAGCQQHKQAKVAAKERWDKASAQIKLSLAQQQYDNERYEQAAKLLNECLNADPEKVEAHLLMGKLCLAEGSVRQGSSELALTVQMDPNLAEGWYWHGVALQQLGRNDEALTSYTEAMRIYPTNVEYILAVAETCTATDRSDDAIKLLEEKIAVMPRNVSLKVAEADLLCRIQKTDQAIELYRQAMLLDTSDESVAESLGYCYIFEDRWKEAADIFNELASKFDGQAPVGDDSAAGVSRRKLYLETAAYCSMNAGEYDKAVASYGKLTVEQRDDAQMWLKMGQAALGAGMSNRALRCGQRALSIRADFSDAVALVGCAQYMNGDYTLSLESFEQIITDEANGSLAWLMMARCYERLNQPEKAAGAYSRALEINPDSQLGGYLGKNLKVADERNW